MVYLVFCLLSQYKEAMNITFYFMTAWETLKKFTNQLNTLLIYLELLWLKRIIIRLEYYLEYEFAISSWYFLAVGIITDDLIDGILIWGRFNIGKATGAVFCEMSVFKFEIDRFSVGESLPWFQKWFWTWPVRFPTSAIIWGAVNGHGGGSECFESHDKVGEQEFGFEIDLNRHFIFAVFGLPPTPFVSRWDIL